MKTTHLEPVTYLQEKDPILAQIIQNTPAFKQVDWQQDVYLALLESVVSQQISVKAADSIFARFKDLFENSYPSAEILVTKTDDELRTAGLSFQKIKYLKNIAQFHIDRGIYYDQFQKLEDEEIVQFLIPIKGIGRWTVEMLLMFVMDRPDVFPIDDLVIRQKIIKAYNVENLTGKLLYARLNEIADNWRPHRTLACRYLWRWKPNL